MKKVLIADDEPAIRKLYERELKKEGYDVLFATNGQEAVQMVREGHPDVIVLDIRMPGMDGLEAMGRILDQHPSIPVLLNTAYSSYQDSFLSWGADAYVIKSSDTGDLRREVEQLLTGKREGARRRPGGQPHAQS